MFGNENLSASPNSISKARTIVQGGLFRVMASQVTDENIRIPLVKLFEAAEFPGVAGEFRCHSLHRSQISQDL